MKKLHLEDTSMTFGRGRSRETFRGHERDKRGVSRSQTTSLIGEASSLNEDLANKPAVVDAEDHDIDMLDTLDSELGAIYKSEESKKDRFDPYAIIMDATLEDDNENDAGTLLLKGKTYLLTRFQ